MFVHPIGAECPPRLQILNQEIDSENKEPSHYRMLYNGRHFKYISIDAGILEADEL